MSPDDLRLLVLRRNRALARMQALSEANGSRPFTPDRVARSEGGSGPPPGVNLERIRSQKECPEKARSLYDFYVWQFARATEADLPVLCTLAETDLKARTHTGEPTADRHRARNRSILSSKYIDQRPEVVAAAEDCTEAHVRKWRKANGLNPKTARHERRENQVK